MMCRCSCFLFFFFFQAEDGIRDVAVTGVQTCALPIYDMVLPPGQGSKPGGQRVFPRPASARSGGAGSTAASRTRSEERRVGKECRSRGGPEQEKKKAAWSGHEEGCDP